MSWEALGSTASFDHVLYDGAQFGHSGEVLSGSEEEMDFLGIPGLLEPDQVRALLHQRQNDRRRPATGPGDEVAALRDGSSLASSGTEIAQYEQLAVLRRELNGLVAAWHHRTGQPHGVTHADLRKQCGGPAAAVASADQLRDRITRLREMAARRTS